MWAGAPLTNSSATANSSDRAGSITGVPVMPTVGEMSPQGGRCSAPGFPRGSTRRRARARRKCVDGVVLGGDEDPIARGPVARRRACRRALARSRPATDRSTPGQRRRDAGPRRGRRGRRSTTTPGWRSRRSWTWQPWSTWSPSLPPPTVRQKQRDGDGRDERRPARNARRVIAALGGTALAESVRADAGPAPAPQGGVHGHRDEQDGRGGDVGPRRADVEQGEAVGEASR